MAVHSCLHLFLSLSLPSAIPGQSTLSRSRKPHHQSTGGEPKTAPRLAYLGLEVWVAVRPLEGHPKLEVERGRLGERIRVEGPGRVAYPVLVAEEARDLSAFLAEPHISSNRKDRNVC